MGAPKRDVTALIGSVPLNIDNWDTISQINKIVEPQRIDAGNMIFTLEVLNTPRAICGTVIPIKPIGPVKAVAVPAKTAVIIII